MRRLIAYLFAIILAVSCVSQLEQGTASAGASLEGAPVTITFSVPDIAVLPASKSLEDGDGDITDTPYLDPEKMYLIVCGSSQSIKYIRKAKLIKTDDDFTIPEELYPLSEGERVTTLYTFKVQLELSDVPRTVHILGNVDENQLITGSYSYQSLPGMLSYDNKQAYWQKLQVPYIKANINSSTQEPEMDDGSYLPDDETARFFQYIPLIRNFAKIQVINKSENFQLHSYAVIYYPERGSVVPYRSNEAVAENRFDFNPPSGYRLSGYERCPFEYLESSINYLGNMPASVALSQDIPDASEFVDPGNSKGKVLLYDENDPEQGFFIFERGVPTDKIGPTFIIVCGKFEDDDNWYYYRLDLMESKVEGNQTVSRYYPIYRNFRYEIQLHRISSEGVLTPELAAVSSGAEDISADVSMRHLSDISNGTTRLVVEPFMTRTYSGPAEEGEYYELYARFFNSVTSDVPNLNTAAVRVELEPIEGSDNILILYDDNGYKVPSGGYFFPQAKTVGGVDGIRTIRFNTIEPQDKTLTQKIKITGHNPGNPQDLRLYREVEITLQKKQPLTITCPEFVPPVSNAPLTVGITIPSELPESMFPLEFIVEPEARTLTPDTSKDINLPVHSGRSIATTESVFTDTPAFYYLRTLTWEEFSHLDASGGQRTFYCYFKSNQANSATSIWVYNEYFSKDSASFSNILPLTVTCTDPVIGVTGSPVTVGITVPSDVPQAMFPLTFVVEPEDMTLTPDTSKGISMPEESGHFTRTLTWNDYTKLTISGDSRTFYCYFLTTREQSATTIRVRSEYFSESSASFANVLPLTVTCTDPVLNVVNTPVTVGITVPSDVPQSLFPLAFIVEPAAMTLTPDTSQGIDLPVESGHFIRTLTWEEFSHLDASGGQRTFSCYFLTTQDQSATTIRVYNEHFIEGNVPFDNYKNRPNNHFYVFAIDDCTVKLGYAGEYRIDDGKWMNFSANQNITLTAGQKISFCVGSYTAPVKTWNPQGKFSCTGGRFKVGGNLASLIVGDDYESKGSEVTGASFLDFFKANTNLVDAYMLELPMLNVAASAYKSMFDNCSNLQRGPQLLPGISLGETCYRNMFYNCAQLENAPVLAATKLTKGCYQRMFYGCVKINYIKMLGTQNYRDDEFIVDGTHWCGGVAASGELWLDSSLSPVTNYGNSWNKIVPAGWTVKFVGIDEE